MLAEQCVHAAHTVGLLVHPCKPATLSIGRQIRQDEHAADRIKVRNLHILNESFSTRWTARHLPRHHRPRRSGELLQVHGDEMELLGTKLDDNDLQIAIRLNEGVAALVSGFAKLGNTPDGCGADADLARKAERQSGEALPPCAGRSVSRARTTSTCSSAGEIYRHPSNAGPDGALRQYAARHRGEDLRRAARSRSAQLLGQVPWGKRLGITPAAPSAFNSAVSRCCACAVMNTTGKSFVSGVSRIFLGNRVGPSIGASSSRASSTRA